MTIHQLFFFANALLKAKEQYVLLIDEYDAPLTATYGDPEKFEAIRGIITDFYATIKAHLDTFRFVFITGLWHSPHTSLLSEGSNITDLTLHSEYGALLGYTQQELEDNFGEYLDNAVEIVKASKSEPLRQEYNRALLLQELKLHYDGYCFDREGKYKLYNPWSIIQCLSSPSQGFISYWYSSGSFMPIMLYRYIKNILHRASEHSDTTSTLSTKVSEELSFLLNVDATCIKRVDELLPRVENLSTIDPFAILYPNRIFHHQRACVC